MSGYRGRFAPTPSGPLHFGSLVAALASCLDARAHGGAWLVRIEDLDPPRIVPGADRAILATLAAHGFTPDEAVLWQSRRQDAYADALERLRAQEGGPGVASRGQSLIYGCTCSRKQLAERAARGVDGPVYPGTCRGRPVTPGTAQRMRLPEQRIVFHDRLLGRVACDLARECGDCVLRRADGVFSYQLAVVVDDAAQGITDVVRGADLLASTPRQIALQRALGLPEPRTLHLPVVLGADGCKLSKQTLATPLIDAEPLPALRAAARFLGLDQRLETSACNTLAAFWRVAIETWPHARLPPVTGLRVKNS